jgi:D-arabinan exo alpha-(1,3)/(1,5)-arabinofuranosidase (non-reducing end)
MGQNYLVADITGRGHFVGTVLNWRQLSPSWPGEGDDFWFIDGEQEPSLRGTGTEDYFCDGWGFRKQAGPFYGAPLMEGSETGNRTSVYRWHIPDPVPFSKSLRLEFEHKGVTFNADGSVKSGFEERPDEFSSVAFWYQMEPHKPFPAMAGGYARLPFDYSKMTAGEKLIPGATATEGPIEPQDLGAGKQLWWRPSKEDQALTVTFEVAESGNYEMLLFLTKSWDYGNYQIELDGKPLGPVVDLYSATIADQELPFPVRRLEAGRHSLVFRNRGKDAASKGYLFGLSGILLQKR